jgi:cell division protein FtsW
VSTRTGAGGRGATVVQLPTSASAVVDDTAKTFRPRRRTGRRTGTFVALVALLALLNLTGVVMVLSASGVGTDGPWTDFTKQLIWLGLGTVAAAVISQIDYRMWRKWAGPLLLVTIGLLVLVLVPHIGVEANGASRWIGWGSLTFQPSELAKLAMLLFVADLLTRRAHRIDQTQLSLRPVMVVFAIVAGLIMLQPNLGTTILVFAIVFSLLVVAGVPSLRLGVVLIGAAGVGALFLLLTPFRRARLLAFTDPWADAMNTGYQPLQSQVGLADGGLLGKGLGAGRAKYGFLPEVHTDFIFTVIGEELGLLGACVLLAAFIALAIVGVRIALRAPDRFGMLVATGITAWILFQAFMNIGAAVGVLPIVGVPLPFVSFGGSSLLVTMVAMGILLNIARQTVSPGETATVR